MVCCTVQVFRVVLTSMPISRPTSQDPESLTWLAKTDPAAVARTMATTFSALPRSPRRRPSTTRATSTVISNATGVDPMVDSSAGTLAVLSRVPSPFRKSMPVFMSAPGGAAAS